MRAVSIGWRCAYVAVAVILALVAVALLPTSPVHAAAAPLEETAPSAPDTSAAVTPMAVPAQPGYTPLTPVRVADTRPGQQVAFPAAKAPVAAGATLQVPVAGTNGIPADAAALVATVTAVAPAGGGHLRVFPCGQALPNASTLNYRAATTVANAAIIATGTGGRLCVYTPTTTHVIVDITGYVAAGTPYVPVAPVRVADTRPGEPVAYPPAKFILPGGQSLGVPAAGSNGIPADAAAVVVNVTATQPVAAGHLRVFNCNQVAPPPTSTLNYPAGASVANLAVVAVHPGDGREICVYTPVATHVIVDITGYFPAGADYRSIPPTRVADTRPNQPVPDPIYKLPLRPGQTLEVRAANTRDVPMDAVAVVANVTATQPAAHGHLRVFPCGQPLPGASTLNYLAGATVANAAIVAPNDTGYICVYSPVATHVVVDITGYFPATGSDRIDAGSAHTCAIVSGGQVRCFGRGESGQLGDGTLNNRTSAVTVAGIRGAVAVTAGDFHSCALLSDGQVKCWGSNDTGQLGNGTTTNSTTPVTVAGLSGATAVSGGNHFTCAIVTGGQVKCWGTNAYGQLGDGSGVDRTRPVTVAGLSGVTSLSAGGVHACAVVNSGQVHCWGYNQYGQLGNGSTSTYFTPIPVSGMPAAKAVSAGYLHTCAIARNLASTTTKCWGNNAYGQLGDGTTTDRTVPVTASGVSNAHVIDAGRWHTCAARTALAIGDQIKCWGENYYGQLGNGTNSNFFIPEAIPGDLPLASLSAGDGHTCAITQDSKGICWGSNVDGQLGLGSNINRSSPIIVGGLG